MSVRAELGVVACVPKGQWHDYEEYEYLNIVTDNGSAYIAKKTVPVGALLTDTEYWDILVRKGDKGDTGNGIASVTKTGTSGLVDTYTITFTDGTTTTYNVTNGAKGDKGDTGNGIASITKTGTSGNVDTYTITYTDGTTTTYEVTNGSVTSVNGMTGDVIVRNVEHADIADNLSPYSENSGVIQDTPFISQETGTANNTVIVTTGDKAKQLEKLGNAIIYNQALPEISNVNWELRNATGSFGTNSTTFRATTQNGGVFFRSTRDVIAGHKYLLIAVIKTTTDMSQTLQARYSGSTFNFDLTVGSTTATQYLYGAFTATVNSNGSIYVRDTRLSDWDDISVSGFYMIDLTQWFNCDIPQDVLNNPSHFSWYYNGELTFNAGEIKHGEGVKLVCTRGRNLVGGDYETGSINNDTGLPVEDSSLVRTKNFKVVVPNTKLYITKFGTVNARIYFYDKNKNFIGSTTAAGNIINVPANAVYYKDRSTGNYGGTYHNDHDVTPYYTEQQGGEGYGLHYDYEEPDIIDTGSEQLGAFDKKTPDGVIHRKTIDVAGIADSEIASVIAEGSMWRVFLNSTSPIYHKTTSYPALICASYAKAGNYADVKLNDKTIGITANGEYIMLHDSSLADATAVRTALATLAMQVEASEETTEQGTSFRQYAGINDYGIMYWLNANDELVSIPQGCKIQYPVNYKGYVDDLYMYTDGDVTKLAKNESITDAALNARGYYKMQDLLIAFGANGMVGGTLKHMYAEKYSVDYLNVICVDWGDLDWVYYTSGTNNGFYALITGMKKVNNMRGICTDATIVGDGYTGSATFNWDNNIYRLGTNEYIYVRCDAYTNATAFKNAKKGVLIAVPKAST